MQHLTYRCLLKESNKLQLRNNIIFIKMTMTMKMMMLMLLMMMTTTMKKMMKKKNKKKKKKMKKNKKKNMKKKKKKMMVMMMRTRRRRRRMRRGIKDLNFDCVFKSNDKSLLKIRNHHHLRCLGNYIVIINIAIE